MEHIGHPIVGDAMYGTRNKPYINVNACMHQNSPLFLMVRMSHDGNREVGDDFGREK